MYKTLATFNCKCSKTCHLGLRLLFVGQVSVLGGCRSRLSYSLVSCSQSVVVTHTRRLVRNDVSKKKHAHQWAGRNVWQCEAKRSWYRLWRCQARLKLSDALSYTWTRGGRVCSEYVCYLIPPVRHVPPAGFRWISQVMLASTLILATVMTWW